MVMHVLKLAKSTRVGDSQKKDHPGQQIIHQKQPYSD